MISETAIIVGVGPGLGGALARRFAAGGFHVVMAARDEANLTTLAEPLRADGLPVTTHACDATDAAAVADLFAVVDRIAPLGAAIYNAGAFVHKSILEATPDEFERCWRIGCHGGFLVGQQAALRMVERERGTILFTGATASMRGSAKFFNLAVGKFGLRALAQSMARELGPRGVHVAHVVVDGQILSPRYAHLAEGRPDDGLLRPDAMAETYWQLHAQHRSAWTQELDLRPWVEKF